MERTVVLNKMKKLDNIVIGSLTFGVLFIVILTLLGKVEIPLYFSVILILFDVVAIILTAVNKKYKTELIQAVNDSFSAVYNNDLSSIRNNNSNEIYNLVNVLLNEMEDVKNDLNTLLKLTRAIEKDEINDFHLTSKNKNVTSAIRVIKSIELENNTNKKVTTEFFKNVKTGKFNDIEVDSENIIQQQLNVVLQNMYTMNSNLRIVQAAIFEGDYDVEIITTGVDGDFLNITNKLKTLLQSAKKSTNNLNKAILMMDEENQVDFTNSLYKGHLVTSFKLIEMVYENLRLSIDNIVYALENSEEISVDNVSELFNPILKVITSEGYETSYVHKNNVTDDSSANKVDNNSLNKNTGNYEIIENIENKLNDLKVTMETNEFFDYEFDIEKLDNKEVDAKAESDITKIEIELKVVEENQQIDNEEQITNIETVETELEVVEDNEELDKTEQITETEEIEEIDIEISETELEVVEEKRQQDNTEQITNIETIETELEIIDDNEELNNTEEVVKTLEIIENENYDKVLEKLLTKDKKTKKKKTKEKSDRTGVSRLSQTNSSSKKPLTYQEAIKSGQIEELTKNKRKINTLPNNMSNKSLKEPMTYQKFLDSNSGNASSNNEKKTNTTKNKKNKNIESLIVDNAVARDNLMKQEAEKKERRQRTQTQINSKSEIAKMQKSKSEVAKKSDRVSFKDKRGGEQDSLKRRSKLEEQMGRKLTNRERNELDMYGEILDDKYRAIMEKITNEADLGGF